jgi:CBS domain containing-hemolysin-like protein
MPPDPEDRPKPAAAGTPSEPHSPRTLLSEIGARIAQALRDLRTDSTIRESLEEVIEESAREISELGPQERLLLANLLKFGELTVEDVMVPRADIVAIEEQSSLAELLAVFREAQHSRVPLYRESIDNPIGMIHVKDALNLVEADEKGNLRWPDSAISKLKREVLFVPGAMPTLDLLMKMQQTHIHLALVVDEDGGTAGLVSIEDLMEEIVGDIEDEHDVAEHSGIDTGPDGSFDADALTELDAFKETTGIDLSVSDDEDGADVDTLGGVVLAALGRVPDRGEIISHPSGYVLEVLDADTRRVKRVRVRRVDSRAHAD